MPELAELHVVDLVALVVQLQLREGVAAFLHAVQVFLVRAQTVLGAVEELELRRPVRRVWVQTPPHQPAQARRVESSHLRPQLADQVVPVVPVQFEVAVFRVSVGLVSGVCVAVRRTHQTVQGAADAVDLRRPCRVSLRGNLYESIQMIEDIATWCVDGKRETYVQCVVEDNVINVTFCFACSVSLENCCPSCR